MAAEYRACTCIFGVAAECRACMCIFGVAAECRACTCIFGVAAGLDIVRARLPKCASVNVCECECV